VVHPKVYYYLTDHLGTPQKVMDNAGAVVWSGDYKPFGEVTTTVSTVDNHFRFPGQFYDLETGSHYNYHRYYQPRSGRYVTPDPIGIKGGINLFAYAKENPLKFTDPFGLWIYKGYCRFISGGEGIGAGQLRCRVWTECRSDGYREIGELVAVFGGITAGLPASVTYFNIQQDSRDYSNDPTLADLAGWSSIYTISSALGVGSSITVLNLGTTRGEYAPDSYQFGIDASADAFGGYSWIEWQKREKCCE
jgi:RHS repeat-associated protein